MTMLLTAVRATNSALFPPPLWGRVREGGGMFGNAVSMHMTPTPNPSPPSGRSRPSSTACGGGEHAATRG